MTYFAMHNLGLDFDESLYEVPASRLMLLLNQNAIVNIGEEKCMTLSDIESMERMKNARK